MPVSPDDLTVDHLQGTSLDGFSLQPNIGPSLVPSYASDLWSLEPGEESWLRQIAHSTLDTSKDSVSKWLSPDAFCKSLLGLKCDT